MYNHILNAIGITIGVVALTVTTIGFTKPSLLVCPFAVEGGPLYTDHECGE